MLDLRGMYLPDLLAWRTWRDIGFWTDMEHLSLALVGENGEAAELLKKERFKPGWEMAPFARIDELGDLWYYCRILGIYSNQSATMHSHQIRADDHVDLWRFHVIGIPGIAITVADYAETRENGDLTREIKDFVWLLKTAARSLGWTIELGWTIDQLTLLNWLKLEGGKHGWPDKTIDIPRAADIMKALALDTGDFERVYTAHRALGRTLNTEWAEYAFGSEVVTDEA